jgi:hypothetical protein
MFLKFYHHLHPLFEVKSYLFILLMKIITWTFLRWRLAPMNLKRRLLLKIVAFHKYQVHAKYIKCPLEWWKKHRTMFSIIGFLAR